MIRLLLCGFAVTVALASPVLFEAPFYKILKMSKIKGKTFSTYWNSEFKATVQKIYAGDIPKDNGKDNYGDLEFVGTLRNGTLLARDTVVNDDYEENIVIRYNRTLPGHYITDAKVFNFGRQRGYCHSANIWHKMARVDAEIIVASGNTVRMFVEIYGWKV